MTTKTKDDIGNTWVDIVAALSLQDNVAYILQNVTPYPLELILSATLPDTTDFGNTVLLHNSLIITVRSGIGIYVRNQNNDDKKKCRIVVTELINNVIPIDSSNDELFTADNPGFISGPGDTITEGNQDKQLVQDNNSEQLLTNILKELKKMNLHLAIINDTYIQNTEVD